MLSISLSAAALVAFFTAVNAQVPNFAATDVPIGDRNQWCVSQVSSCPLICLQEEAQTAATEANTCDPQALTYLCICDNGLQPNASEYSQTLPYFICTENNNICVKNCGMGNNACASSCRQDHPCGAQNPTRVNTSTVTTSATATDGTTSPTGSDTVFTGFGGDSSQASSTGSSDASTSSGSSSSTSSSSASSIVLNAGEMYGLAVVGLGIFTGFTFFL